MGTTFTTLDLIVFFGSLIAVMSIGLLAGRKEETSEDYFLAGRRIPWWGVAGSIYGSNVSANHMIGMMGIGFSVGFAQSHLELGAIAGLMLLCYGFLPVYRRLKVYTLSEYLGQRFDDRSRLRHHHDPDHGGGPASAGTLHRRSVYLHLDGRRGRRAGLCRKRRGERLLGLTSPNHSPALKKVLV